jgi:dihydroorotase
MKKYLIKDAQLVNEGNVYHRDVLIENQRITKIDERIQVDGNVDEIHAEGLHLIPGLIDDQVHFREPGLTHKAEIYTEAKAAVAGGITSYMEMPNVIPQTLTQELLQDKYDLASKKSLANYSFFMGASNENIEEILKTDPKKVCGLKVFMGSSTGDMLVDNPNTLENIFSKVGMLIATHCEDEATIRRNTALAREKYGDSIPFEKHPEIRSVEACYLSSSMAIELAKKYQTRLHILHISTGKETSLFTKGKPSEKHITSEACIHHLWFTDDDYPDKGPWIKWNPAVKSSEDRSLIRKAVINDQIDVIATDHAPHAYEEKNNPYHLAPSGGPLVQHALPALLDLYHQGVFTLTDIVRKTSHAVAECFQLEDRGFIKEGYYADLVLVDLNSPWSVSKDSILYKCGWSPFEGHSFKSRVMKTFVSGHLAYDQGQFDESIKGSRLFFKR